LFNRKVLNSCEEIGINHRTLILQHLIIFDSINSHFFIQSLRICLSNQEAVLKKLKEAHNIILFNKILPNTYEKIL